MRDQARRFKSGVVYILEFFYLPFVQSASIRLHFAAWMSIVLQCKMLKDLTGGSNSMVESQPSKLLVASSILVSRSIFQQHRRPAVLRYGLNLLIEVADSVNAQADAESVPTLVR